MNPAHSDGDQPGPVRALKRGDMVANHFKELIVWQLADELRREVYRVIDDTPASRDLDFRTQLQDAVSGIAGNIADGFRRGDGSAPDFARLVTYAFSCLDETEDRLIDGTARGFWNDEALIPARRLIRRLTPAMSNFLRYLNTPAAQQRAREIRRRPPKPKVLRPGAPRPTSASKGEPSEPPNPRTRGTRGTREPDEPDEPVNPTNL